MHLSVVQPSPGTLIITLPAPQYHGRQQAPLKLRVTALQNGAVRITRSLRESFLPFQSNIVLDAREAALTPEETPEAILARCGQITLRITKATGSIAFHDAAGRLLLSEGQKAPCILEERPVMVNVFPQGGETTYSESADGIRASADEFETREDRVAYTVKQTFEFDSQEGLYGLGSHEEGYGNLRGRMRELYQHNMKAVVPVLVSTRGWGILFDLECFMVFHDDAEGSYLWADCADEMDYYFMAGGYQAVMAAYAALTGPTPMPPRYAFGYIQSKERYQSAGELIEVVSEYRRRKIPLDVIVQDWRSWPEGQWGYKVFDPERYPDPREMTDTLHRLGARLMISIWPSMQGDRNQNRAEMLEKGLMLGNRTIYNAFLPQARETYWRQALDGLFSKGVDAWWCDCTEPFESDWRGRVKPEPWLRAQLNTGEAKKYLDPGHIQAYSLHHSRGIYEGQRAYTDQKRVLNLTRSSYAGQHRSATVTWSGDVSANWEVLRRQVPEGLNFCATGENYWTTDIGGFFPGGGGAWFSSGDYPQGADDLGYRELYVRWLQYAAFLPMMRSHGTGTPREIWRFGEEGGMFYDAIAKAIRMRSAMVPYLYSLAARCTGNGMPMLTIPALAFPEDSRLTAVNDQMILGGDLLIKPVTRPMHYGPGSARLADADGTESVYLPQSCDWYSLEGERRYAGGQTVTVDAPLDTIPVFARAGSILFWGPPLQHVDEPHDEALAITVYPGSDGHTILYDDAGNGYGYERGESCRIRLDWQDKARTLMIGGREGTYPGMKARLALKVRRAGGPAADVVYDGSAQAIVLE